jgi:RNA polymerase sigma-70 factor (ECF subfamily)
MTARAGEQRVELDSASLEALFVRCEKPVFNVVYRWLWNADEARDVTQEAFMKLWAARARVDAETAEPLLFRAALNLAANRLRGRKLWRLLTLEPLREHPHEQTGADATLEVEQRRLAVRKAIEALPEKLKQVVVMCELSGLSYQQISEALKIPTGTVGSRRSLALTALEQSLGRLELE